MSKNSTAQKTGQANNVIFIHCPHDSDPVNADAAPDTEKFSDRPHGRRVNAEFSVPDVPQKELKNMFRHEWNSFRAMKYERCGKNGKYVCHESIAKFPQFLAAFGPCTDPAYTLDRLDPTDLEYAPGKCIWASGQRQAENKRSTKYLETSDGTRLSVSEWSRRTGIPRKTIHERLKRGWSHDDAVGIRTGGKRSDSNSQAKPRTRSLFPNKPPTYLQTMLDQWTAGLKEHHDCPVFLLEWKHIKTLEYIHEGLLRCEVSPASVIRCVVENWHRVTCYDDAPRHSKPLRTPDLNYLKSNITAAAVYYLNRGGKRLSDEHPEQFKQPADPGQFDDLL